MMNDLQTPLFSQSDASTDRIHVFWDAGMLSHDPGKGVFDTGMDPGFLDVLDSHPENSDRVRNLLSILKRGPISPFISWHSGRPALTSELLSFHTPGLASLLHSFSPLFSLGQEFVEPTNILIMNTHLNNLFVWFVWSVEVEPSNILSTRDYRTNSTHLQFSHRDNSNFNLQKLWEAFSKYRMFWINNPLNLPKG